MSREVAKNEWAVAIVYEDLLELRWLPSSASMNDAAVMATDSMFVWAAETVRSPRALIDAVEFRHRVADGVRAWHDAHIVPRLGGAGVRRLARLMSAGFTYSGPDLGEATSAYATRWFSSREEALKWLREI